MNKKVALPIADGMFSTHFGHSENFALYEITGGKISDKKLTDTPPHTPGAFPAWLKQQNVDTVIVAGVGQRAIDLFHEADIEVVIGAQGTDPDEIVQNYLAGKLSVDPEFNTRLHADHHHGNGGNCEH